MLPIHCLFTTHPRRSLPSSLLLLSRAFTVTQPLGRGPRAVDVRSLRETLSTLPDEAVEDVELFETMTRWVGWVVGGWMYGGGWLVGS